MIIIAIVSESFSQSVLRCPSVRLSIYPYNQTTGSKYDTILTEIGTLSWFVSRTITIDVRLYSAKIHISASSLWKLVYETLEGTPTSVTKITYIGLYLDIAPVYIPDLR